MSAPVDGMCPRCMELVAVMPDGRCAWCDARTGAGQVRPMKANRSHAGMPYLMGEDVLDEARRLYASGLSLRRVAAVLHERTDYRNPRALERGLDRTFRLRGWPLRSHADACAMGNRLRTGVAPKRACSATTLDGRPCRSPAMRTGDLCICHHRSREAA